MSDPAAERGLLDRVLFSSDERRLRAGWRLLGHTLLLAIAFAPTAFVFGLAMAVFGAGRVVNVDSLSLGISAIVGPIAITLATWGARRLLDRRSFRSLGLEPGGFWVRDLLVGVAITVPLFGLIFTFEWGMGWLTVQGWSWSLRGFGPTLRDLLLILLAFVSVGFYEELLFRGYYLQNLAAGTNLPVAVLVTSGVFGLAHLGNPNSSWVAALGILFAGLFLSFAWLRTRSLWLPIGLHIGWNFMEGPVFGFAVSGTLTPSLVRQTVDGPELITGGGFGPEAGLVVLPAMAVGAGLIWWYTRRRLEQAAHLAPPVPPATSA